MELPPLMAGDYYGVVSFNEFGDILRIAVTAPVTVSTPPPEYLPRMMFFDHTSRPLLQQPVEVRPQRRSKFSYADEDVAALMHASFETWEEQPPAPCPVASPDWIEEQRSPVTQRTFWTPQQSSLSPTALWELGEDESRGIKPHPSMAMLDLTRPLEQQLNPYEQQQMGGAYSPKALHLLPERLNIVQSPLDSQFPQQHLRSPLITPPCDPLPGLVEHPLHSQPRPHAPLQIMPLHSVTKRGERTLSIEQPLEHSTPPAPDGFIDDPMPRLVGENEIEVEEDAVFNTQEANLGENLGQDTATTLNTHEKLDEELLEKVTVSTKKAKAAACPASCPHGAQQERKEATVGEWEEMTMNQTPGQEQNTPGLTRNILQQRERPSLSFTAAFAKATVHTWATDSSTSVQGTQKRAQKEVSKKMNYKMSGGGNPREKHLTRAQEPREMLHQPKKLTTKTSINDSEMEKGVEGPAKIEVRLVESSSSKSYVEWTPPEKTMKTRIRIRCLISNQIQESEEPSVMTMCGFETVPGDRYHFEVACLDAHGRIVANGQRTVTAFLSKEELNRLMKRANTLAAFGPKATLDVLYMCSSYAYFEQIFNGRRSQQLIFKEHIAPRVGRAESPINAGFFGVKLNTRLDYNGRALTWSMEGDTRWECTALALLDSQRTAFFFADFFCTVEHREKHTIVIVAAKKGSDEEKQCTDWLVPIDLDECNFLRVRRDLVMRENYHWVEQYDPQEDTMVLEFSADPNVVLEMYLLDDVQFALGDTKDVAYNRASHESGFVVNRTCEQCSPWNNDEKREQNE